tara:strand:- start:39 stop:725 length:687 start_codon:yes stop_codon:yes gene_type:complete
MNSFIKKPKISVIIPTFNQEKYIGRCIRSLLEQNIPRENYELIIINDGSHDKTEYAINLFKEPNSEFIKSISNKKNIGLPASINKGIKIASGEYIVRVDSDDFVNKNFLNFLQVYLDTNPDSDAVACDYLILDDNENVLERKNCDENPIACGIMFKKNDLLSIGLYDEKFMYNEERELRIRFCKKYSIRRLDLPLYRYRMHANNITKNNKQMDKYNKLILEKHGIKHL